MIPGPNILDQRREVLRSALRGVGYGDAHVHFDWKISDRDAVSHWRQDNDPYRLPQGTPTSLDLIAFCDERERTWDTTALVAEVSRFDLVQQKDRGHDRAKELFNLTASPCALFAGKGCADLWLKCWDKPELVRDIPFSEESLRARFRQRRRDLEREALARLRGGQRFLFDRVYHARREELVEYLHRGLSKATWLAGSLSDEGREKERKALSRVAIGLMAARILEDKGFFESAEQTTDAREILQKAENRANGFFQSVISDDLVTLRQSFDESLVSEMLRCLMAHFSGPASFTMITAESLGFLHETALTAERRRGVKDLALEGIHYTSRSLAQQILDRIPLEEIRPSQRYVLDMASGSGSFLLSATQRLRGIYDIREEGTGENVVDYLRGHVIGNDIDPIANLVTRLIYLLEHWTQRRETRDVPEPRRLEQRDALTLATADFGDTLPAVVVGNPPFAAHEGGQQLANRFLLKALELLAPGGYLGMILPGSFLKMRRQKSPETRRLLLDQCDLVEVWEQPLQAVGLTARQETCVIIAQKRVNGRRVPQPVVFKATYSSRALAVRALREDLRSTWTFAATGPPGRPDVGWNGDEMSRIIASPIDSVWRKLDLGRTVSELYVTGTGIDAPLNKATFSSRSLRGYRPYLRTQTRLRPYLLLQDDWTNDPSPDHEYLDPNTALWPKEALWSLYSGPKTILRCDTNRNSKLQLAAAFDDAGVFPEHHFTCAGVRDVAPDLKPWATELLANQSHRDLLLWITAILNSPIAHAWVATCAPPRGLLEIVLHTLPLPTEFDPDIRDLVEQTARVPRDFDEDMPLWQARSEGGASQYVKLAAEINRRVLASYGLGRSDVELLDRFLAGMTEPWVDAPENAHLPISGATYRQIAGTVVAVHVRSQQVTLDLPRYCRKAGGAVKVPLPKHMPGWALREGAEFTCLAPADKRDPADLKDPWLLREFRPVPYPYLSPSEIEDMAGYRAVEAAT